MPVAHIGRRDRGQLHLAERRQQWVVRICWYCSAVRGLRSRFASHLDEYASKRVRAPPVAPGFHSPRSISRRRSTSHASASARFAKVCGARTRRPLGAL